MGFFKRNIAFVLLMASAVVAVAVLLFFFVQKRSEAKQKEEEVQKQIAFFEETERGPYTINAANLQQAKENQKRSAAAVQGFVDSLVTGYGFSADRRTGLECVQILRDECARLQKELLSRSILVAPAAADFSFDSVFKSTTPPAESDTPQLLKQMKIIGEIMNNVGEGMGGGGGQVLRVVRLTPPGPKQVKDDLYSVETFELTVVGTDSRIQGLLNRLQGSDAKGIFIVRSIDIQGAMLPADDKSQGGLPVRPGVAPSGRGASMPGAEKEKTVIEKREERAFRPPGDIQAVLLVDFIEFENKK